MGDACLGGVFFIGLLNSCSVSSESSVVDVSAAAASVSFAFALHAFIWSNNVSIMSFFTRLLFRL